MCVEFPLDLSLVVTLRYARHVHYACTRDVLNRTVVRLSNVINYNAKSRSMRIVITKMHFFIRI